jgi:hypothetical protein
VLTDETPVDGLDASHDHEVAEIRPEPLPRDAGGRRDPEWFIGIDGDGDVLVARSQLLDERRGARHEGAIGVAILR